GTNHQVGREARLVKSLSPWLPGKVLQFLSPKYPHSEINLREAALVVWVNTLDGKTGEHVDCQHIRMEFIDDQGDLFGEETRSWFGHDKFWRDGHVFSAFPRNQSTFTLQILPLQKGTQTTSTVQFPNPF